VAVISDLLWKRLAAAEQALQPQATEEAPRASVVLYELGHLPPEHRVGLQRSQAPGASMQGDQQVVYVVPVNGR
jgi:hypothetical protein